MLTGELRNQIDTLWNTFWTGGISNPLSVIEQITYLLFIKRLDEAETREEEKAQTLNIPMEKRIFPEGTDPKGVPYRNLRWSVFKAFESRQLMQTIDEHVFPFLRQLAETNPSYGQHMRDARFGISNPGTVARAVSIIDDLNMADTDTKGDVYEYMLGKIASAGTNGQFRTPRHIIELMVHVMAPKPDDVIVDPAAGTCGFLVAASEYVRQHHGKALRNPESRKHYHHGMFHAYDFDNTMLRIGAMNMMLHGIEGGVVEYRDSLTVDTITDANRYSLILANPPFAGSIDADAINKSIKTTISTKKTELLFMALFLELLKPGGRAAVIVPDGVLFGSSKAHKDLRKALVEKHQLEAIIKLPSGVFRPYAGVSCAIVIFTKTGTGGTDQVWFYDMTADGYSLDDKRQPLLEATRLGVNPEDALSADEHAKNNLPDILARWQQRDVETKNPRTAQSFMVSKAEIAEGGAYDLSLNRYKVVEHEEVHYQAPAEIIAELKDLESQIAEGLARLEEMLG